jgi:hypothetical protein
VCNFGLRGCAALNVANYHMFRQSLKLPSSGRECNSLACLEALYRAGSRWRVEFDGADWWSERVDCYPVGSLRVIKAFKNAQPLLTHPEDCNCSVCRHVG